MKSLVIILITAMLIISACGLNKTQYANSSDYYSNEFIKLTFPKQSDTILSLNFPLTGEILKPGIEYFFYQVEDGHGFLSTGIVEINDDGKFNTNIEIINPTNPQGYIIFYFDSDNDRKFDLEENVNEEFGMVSISFSPSIEVPLSIDVSPSE